MIVKDWLQLGGRTAAVTGSAGGIGRAIALEFASVGSRVAVLDHDGKGAAETVRMIQDAGGTAFAMAMDVTDDESVASAHRAVAESLGPVGILVNNAALMRPGHLASIAISDWEKLLSVNLSGYLRCAQHFGHTMLERGRGVVLHVASISASNPQPYSGAYSAAKAAVVMLSRQLAYEWGPNGVRSNSVSPGMIVTPLSEDFYKTPGVKERREAIIPARRVGAPEDIARACVFLASDKAGYINGHDLMVDGGYSQTLMGQIPRPGYD